MKKQFLACMMTLLLLLAIVPAAALAADTTGAAAAQTTAAASGSCGENVTWALDDAGTLTISGSGSMDDYFVEGLPEAPWYSYRTSVRQIVIADGVTRIGCGAFRGCSSLTDVTIPDSVTEIDAHAFGGCSSLKSIVIPDSITELAYGLFGHCKSLTDVTIPDSVTKVEGFAFTYCTSLETISLPDSITEIENLAFDGCTGLKSIAIPNGVTEISMDLFRDCRSLETVIIPDSVTRICENAFEGCTSLKTVTIPESVTAIEAAVFYDCTGLVEVNIPDSVTEIGGSLFVNCSSLQKVTLPDYAEYQDSGGDMFTGCTGLTTISLPDEFTEIGYEEFKNCTRLESITIPASITEVGYWAFAGCTGLKDVYFTGTEDQLFAIDFGQGNDGLNNAVIHVNAGPDTEGDIVKNPFADVANISEYYYVPVRWAAETGITAGTTATTFSPDDTCTRAEAIMFLYRYAGEPEVTGSNPFRDVSESDYYYDAVLWAAQSGITYGTEEHTFSPNQMVTRAEFITFLCRAEKVDDSAYINCDFWDVDTEAYYFRAANWGYRNGIVSGTDLYRRTFSPDDPCTRGQVVTFLWRCMEK